MQLDQSTTVGAFHAAYASLVYEGLTSNTVAAYDRAWRLRLAPSLGGMPSTELRPVVIMRARAAWHGAASTKQDAFAFLSRLLDFAVLDGQLPSNPCHNLPRSRKKSVDADPVARAISDQQTRRMLELTAFHPNGQRALAGLVFTGLRLGELAGLRWEDVDTSRGLITIRRTLSPNGSGRLETRPTKSGHLRDVPILDDLEPWLDAAREAGRPHVFTGVRGGPFDSGNLARALKWYSLRDDIATYADGTPLRFHDLRHTFLTRLVRLGVTSMQVRKIAGHASITTTELYTRSSSTEAALAARATVNGATREVTFQGGEAAADHGFTSTFNLWRFHLIEKS
jgi:integrase